MHHIDEPRKTKTLLVQLVDFEEMDAIKILFGKSLAEVERELILETLRRCDGSKRKASAILGISERTMRNKLNEYRIPEDGTKEI